VFKQDLLNVLNIFISFCILFFVSVLTEKSSNERFELSGGYPQFASTQFYEGLNLNLVPYLMRVELNTPSRFRTYFN